MKKKTKWIRILQHILSVLFLAAVVYIIWFRSESIRVQKEMVELNAMKREEQTGVSYVDETGEVTTEKDGRKVLREYQKLYEENKDFIGWIQVADTQISYPVVRTTDNTFYLTHNFYKQNDRYGTIFADCNSSIEKVGQNVLLYGHHMKDGSMFGFLTEYVKESYWEEHPDIEFDTMIEEGVYQVMAVFRSQIYNQEDDVFKYYQYMDLEKEEDFNTFYENVMAMALYQTGITAKYGDELLTLSTCDYSETEGRLVLVARKVQKE